MGCKEIANPFSVFDVMHNIAIHVKIYTLSMAIHHDYDSSVEYLLYMLLSLGGVDSCQHIASLVHLPQSFVVKRLLIHGPMGYFILMNDDCFGGLLHVVFWEEYMIDSTISRSHFYRDNVPCVLWEKVGSSEQTVEPCFILFPHISNTLVADRL